MWYAACGGAVSTLLCCKRVPWVYFGFCPRQRRLAIEADRDDLEKTRGQLRQREVALSLKETTLDSRESEVRRLRRAVDSDRGGLEEARKACLERERGLAVMEDKLKKQEAEAAEVEVRV